jgi:hypothetical protein
MRLESRVGNESDEVPGQEQVDLMASADNCYVCGRLETVENEGWMMYGRHIVCNTCQPKVEMMIEKLRGIRRQ